MSDFNKSLERAAAEVDTWPDWKLDSGSLWRRNQRRASGEQLPKPTREQQEIQRLREVNAALESEIKEWRRSLWLAHGHDMLYGDDGEMQCSQCLLDFKRDSLDKIHSRWHERTALALAEAQNNK